MKNRTVKAVIPSALYYVRVITTTTADGYDKDELTPNEHGTYELPNYSICRCAGNAVLKNKLCKCD